MRDPEGVSHCELAMVAQMPHLTTRIRVRDILRLFGPTLPAGKRRQTKRARHRSRPASLRRIRPTGIRHPWRDRPAAGLSAHATTRKSPSHSRWGLRIRRIPTSEVTKATLSMVSRSTSSKIRTLCLKQ